MVANNPTCNFKDNEVEEVINIVDRRQLWVTAISIVKAMDTSLCSDNYLRDSSIMIKLGLQIDFVATEFNYFSCYYVWINL